MPKVSVLMPVYNGSRYLCEAIDSILGQTFADFELLVIDDGSTDDSAAIVHSHTDGRIRLLSNNGNRGLVYSANRGLDMARGEYVARMDCDDISLPDRFARQVCFLDRNPDVGICGTHIEIFGDRQWINRYPVDDAAIRCELLFGTALAHPSVMMRSSLFRESGLRYENRFANVAEDYDLWVRASQYTRLANLPRVLLRYRWHDSQTSVRKEAEQRQSAAKVRYVQLAMLGLQPDPEQQSLHECLSLRDFSSPLALLLPAEKWLLNLRQANTIAKLFPEPVFAKVLRKRWFWLCDAAARQGEKVGGRFFRSALCRQVGFTELCKYLLRFALRRAF
jgi:glycosyltransferase involved in cell wall biosynthesis